LAFGVIGLLRSRHGVLLGAYHWDIQKGKTFKALNDKYPKASMTNLKALNDKFSKVTMTST